MIDNLIMIGMSYFLFSLVLIVCYYLKLNEYEKEIKDLNKVRQAALSMSNHLNAKKNNINDSTIRFIRKEVMDLYVLCETSKNYTLALHDYSIFAQEVEDLCTAIKYDT